jgi:hypothetical protein
MSHRLRPIGSVPWGNTRCGYGLCEFDEQAVVSQFIANKIDFQRSELTLGLRSRGGQLDGLDDRGIVVFRLVDPDRDRPHPQRFGRERPHQIAGIGLIA